MSFKNRLHCFVIELRSEGVPISQDELINCYKALLHVDWDWGDSFYAALKAALIKDSAYLDIFHRVYNRFFYSDENAGPAERLHEAAELLQGGNEANDSYYEQVPGKGAGNAGEAGEEGLGGEGAGSGGNRMHTGAGKKELLQKDFIALTSDDIRALEELIPIVKRRLTSRMIRKRKKEKPGALDFRRTFRQSLSTGGTPLEIYTQKRIREKPVIFALCDVSSSVWEFSYFSLALVHSLEKFFRHVRSFAFVDEIDEITGMLPKAELHSLRSLVLSQARVVVEGRTNYGFCLKAFHDRYKNELTPRSFILIFGDARNNWFSSESEYLAALAARVKKVIWFNPEKEKYWDTGDSIAGSYQKHCHRFLSCTNILELEKSISQL